MEATFTFPPKFQTSAEDPAVSGLSPIDRLFPQISQGRTIRDKQVWEDYQRDKLRGFTTRELVDLDAVTSRKLRDGDLSHEIHPILSRCNWEKVPDPRYPRTHMYKMPAGFGGSGEWTAENDRVWDAMLPSLKIVTILIEQIHLMPWFTGLFCGPAIGHPDSFRGPLDVSRLRPRDRIKINTSADQFTTTDLFTFRSPGPLTSSMQALAQRKLKFLLDAMSNSFRMQLGIKDPVQNPWNPEESDDCQGVSVVDDGVVFIFLSYALIAPLLRDDLTSGERMGIQYYLANVIWHELSHVLFQTEILLSYGKRYSSLEPYFEDDAIAELGFSAEFAAFGASPYPMLDTTGAEFRSTMGYWLFTILNSVDFGVRTSQYILNNPRLSNVQMVFPIKVSFYEDIQTEEFWKVGIRSFGLEILHARSLTEGSAVYFDGLGFDNEVSLDAVRNSCHQGDRFTEASERMMRFRERLRGRIQRDGLALNAEQRKLQDFGWRVINNSIWEEDFWRHNADTSKYIDGVLPTLSYIFDISDLSTTTQTLKALLDFLKTTRTRHQSAIDSLFMLEHNTSPHMKDTSRRIDLLNWNRGARMYAMEIMILANAAGIDVSTPIWSDEITGLEFARFCLYDMSIYSCVPTLAKENDDITAAYTAIEAGCDDSDEDAFHEAYRIIAPYLDISITSTSIFTRACALIICSAMPAVLSSERHPVEQSQHLETRLQHAQTAIAILEEIDRYSKKMHARASADLQKCYEDIFGARQEEFLSWMEDAKRSVKELEAKKSV